MQKLEDSLGCGSWPHSHTTSWVVGLEKLLVEKLSEIIWENLKSEFFEILHKELVKYRRVLNLCSMIPTHRVIEIWHEAGQQPPLYLSIEEHYGKKKESVRVAGQQKEEKKL